MDKVIKVNGKDRFFYGSYKSFDKAIKVAKLYKESDNCKYSIKKRSTHILVSDVFDLYLNKVSPLVNGVLIL